MEYRSLIRDSNPLFYGKCTVLSPQLDVYTIFENYLNATDISRGCDDTPSNVAGHQAGTSSQKDNHERASSKIASEKTATHSSKKGLFDPHEIIDGRFRIVLNVAYVTPEDLAITFPEPHILQVTLLHSAKQFRNLQFSRLCIYKYELPYGVSKKVLKAVRSLDDYLVIYQYVKVELDFPELRIRRSNAAVYISSEERAAERNQAKYSPKQTRRQARLKMPVIDGTSSQVTKSKVENVPESDPDDHSPEIPLGLDLMTIETEDKLLMPILDPFSVRYKMANLESMVFQLKKVVEHSCFAVANVDSDENKILQETKRRVLLYDRRAKPGFSDVNKVAQAAIEEPVAEPFIEEEIVE